MLFHEKNEMEFTEKKKRVLLEMSKGGHQVVSLEKMKEWGDADSVNYV